MGLISPPKWPSVNPFSHPLGSKIGRKPMVNPSKWVNLKSYFLKFHHRNQAISGIEKARKMAYFRAFLALLSCRLSLAELRSATSGFKAVFKQYFCLFLCIYKAFRALSCCFPLRVNPSIYRLFSIVMRLKSLVYYRCQFPRFIILNLCVNVHRHLAVLVTG